jgi:hypothetical protein
MSFFERNSTIITIVLIGVAVLILLHLYGNGNNTGVVTYNQYVRDDATSNTARDGCVLGELTTSTDANGVVTTDFQGVENLDVKTAYAFFPYDSDENDVINRSKNICTALGQRCKAFTTIRGSESNMRVWGTSFLINDINNTSSNNQLRCATEADYQQFQSLNYMEIVKTYEKN